LSWIVLVKDHGVLQSESLTRFYDAREAAVSARSNHLAWIKRNWSAAVGTSNFLNHRHREHLDYICLRKGQHEFSFTERLKICNCHLVYIWNRARINKYSELFIDNLIQYLRGLKLMVKDILLELHEDNLREIFNKYTRKAYQMLPKLVKPRIVDIGCGSGVPTIELARLSDGQIIGLDIDQSLLDKLNKKIEEEGFTNRVKTVKCSMLEINFPDESFDIIWAEGSISRIGLEKGLKEWRRLLKPNGFLVVHDEIKNITKKLKLMPNCGYNLLGYFPLPEDAWWIEYYGPLEKRIQELSIKYAEHPEILRVLDKKKNEIKMIKKNPKNYGSVFFIMQKCARVVYP